MNMNSNNRLFKGLLKNQSYWDNLELEDLKDFEDFEIEALWCQARQLLSNNRKNNNAYYLSELIQEFRGTN